jgi:hypothetical protein
VLDNFSKLDNINLGINNAHDEGSRRFTEIVRCHARCGLGSAVRATNGDPVQEDMARALAR